MLKYVIPAIGFVVVAAQAEAQAVIGQKTPGLERKIISITSPVSMGGREMSFYSPGGQEFSNGTYMPRSPVASSSAPKLVLVASETHEIDMAQTVMGDLTLTGGFSRATLPNAPVAGGFLEITNNGAEDDVLVGAKSDVAGRMEIHEMSMENDVMRMRELEEGLLIPAGETVTLKPGGFHIMFFDLKQPFVEGETIPVNLTFEKAGTVEFDLTVGASNAKTSDHEMHMDHGAHENSETKSE